MGKLNDLLKRSVSGLIFVGLVTASIFLGRWYFGALFLAVTLYSCYEFKKMLTHLSIRLCTPTLLTSAGLLFISGFLHTEYHILWGYVLTLLSTFVIMLVELYRKRLHAIHNVGLAIFALFYIAAPFTMLLYFPSVRSSWDQDAWRPITVFMPFIVVWLNDTFAYLCGMTFGKHKLFERLSPKKTWEGAIGGGLIAIAGGALVSHLFAPDNIIHATVVSLIVVVFGNLGDLFESMIKRTIEIKDSGHFMPGHGGILDRMDSLLFAIPAVFIYLVIVYLVLV